MVLHHLSTPHVSSTLIFLIWNQPRFVTFIGDSSQIFIIITICYSVILIQIHFSLIIRDQRWSVLCSHPPFHSLTRCERSLNEFSSYPIVGQPPRGVGACHLPSRDSTALICTETWTYKTDVQKIASLPPSPRSYGRGACERNSLETEMSALC